MRAAKVQVGDLVRLISPEDLMRGEEGRVEKYREEGRWEVRMDDTVVVYRHETELRVIAAASPQPKDRS